LIEYKIFKNISTYLEERECAELHAVYKDPEYIPVMTQDAEVEINPEDIFKAYSNIFSLYNDEIEFKDFSQEIVREVFTVEEKIEYIEHQFELNRSGELHFSELFRKKVSRGEVVVTFLALLEMYKINNIRLFQNRVFQEIIIRQRTEE
ncbi:MAG: segregation and condensation protein A, partial [Eubacterium callanderi]